MAAAGLRCRKASLHERKKEEKPEVDQALVFFGLVLFKIDQQIQRPGST
jgi:hypothetical protein